MEGGFGRYKGERVKHDLDRWNLSFGHKIMKSLQKLIEL